MGVAFRYFAGIGFGSFLWAAVIYTLGYGGALTDNVFALVIIPALAVGLMLLGFEGEITEKRKVGIVLLYGFGISAGYLVMGVVEWNIYYILVAFLLTIVLAVVGRYLKSKYDDVDEDEEDE